LQFFPLLVADLDVLHDLSQQVYVVDAAAAQTYHVTLLVLLEQADAEEGEGVGVSVSCELVALVIDGAVGIKAEYDDGGGEGVLALDVGAEAVEIIGESEHAEGFAEGYPGFADGVHGHLIVEIDEVVFLVQYVGVVVGTQED
jgi:hypothetical protein